MLKDECTEEEDEKGSEEEKRQHETLFNSLMQECKYSAPGARLSAKLRTALERLSPRARRGVCERTREGCAPLFVASRRGNVEIVEYLVHVCAVDIEQCGQFEVPDERSVHTVTPLWCAAVSGHRDAVRALADAGADLDAPSDSGSTAVRSACFMSHAEVVRLLVERGADIHRPNHNGGTCLINSVQSARLCEYLLDRGADVNARDTQLKTVLHYAIQEHRVETARLLLERGADPRVRSRAGDDALRTACLKGAAQIVRLLAARVPYGAETLADAHELLGATMLDEFNDVAAALAAWRRATALRHGAAGHIAKRGWRAPAEGEAAGGEAEGGEAARDEAEAARLALGGAREWVSLRELQALAEEVEAMRTQSLLVTSRVLGPDHKDTLFRLMYRGAAHADAGRHRRAAHLWSWALAARLRRDTVLHGDAAHAACALTRLLLDAGERADHGDALRAFRLLAARLPEGARLLLPRPRARAQAEAFDRALRCVTHLALVLVRAAATPGQHARTRAALAALAGAGLRGAATGDTVLHLAASRLNAVRSTYFAEEAGAAPAFPSVRLVAALLAAGAEADALNESRSTALHVAAIPYNFSTELVETLLAAGAHLDRPNRFGDSAAELVVLNRHSRVRVLRHVSLRCLAARALLRATAVARGAAARGAERWRGLPATLVAFLDLHTP